MGFLSFYRRSCLLCSPVIYLFSRPRRPAIIPPHCFVCLFVCLFLFPVFGVWYASFLFFGHACTLEEPTSTINNIWTQLNFVGFWSKIKNKKTGRFLLLFARVAVTNFVGFWSKTKTGPFTVRKGRCDPSYRTHLGHVLLDER